MGAVVLEVKDLSYSYKGSWLPVKIKAISDLSLSVAEGEFFGFIGHNGAGKTTSIKCILGLVKPTAGEIRIFGKDREEVGSRRYIGYLPEQPYFYDYLTVAEILDFYAVLSGLEGSRSEIKRRVAEVAERLGIAGRLNSKMRQLSKGLTQRVGMAQAIIGRPKLLILDEPFSGLDPLGRREFRELMIELNRSGTTIFMSSHVLSDVEYLCDRVAIMSGGELKTIFDLTSGEKFALGRYEIVLRGFDAIHTEIQDRALELKLREDPLGSYARAILKDYQTGQEMIALAVNAGATVESFGRMHGGLEEIFIETVGQQKGD